MSVKFNRASVEMIECRWTSTDVDPSTLPVLWSFTATTAVEPVTWTAGTWRADAALSGTTWTATAVSPVIGTGALDLAAGAWKVWVKLDGTTEDPVREPGTLTVT